MEIDIRRLKRSL